VLTRALSIVLGGVIGGVLLLVSVGSALPQRVVAQAVEPSCAAQTDPDAPISVKSGDSFAIGVSSNHTTGYSWQLSGPPDAAIAQMIASVYVLPAPAGAGAPLIGAGGRECWIFNAGGAGTTTIGMDYLRPFDPPGTPPGQSATFTIVVGP
jgi:inhibitor of cysteine peptidase